MWCFYLCYTVSQNKFNKTYSKKLKIKVRDQNRCKLLFNFKMQEKLKIYFKHRLIRHLKNVITIYKLKLKIEQYIFDFTKQTCFFKWTFKFIFKRYFALILIVIIWIIIGLYYESREQSHSLTIFTSWSQNFKQNLV